MVLATRRGSWRRPRLSAPVGAAPAVAYWLSLPVGPRAASARATANARSCGARRERPGAISRRSSTADTAGCLPTTTRRAATSRSWRARTSPTNIGDGPAVGAGGARSRISSRPTRSSRGSNATLTTLEGLERHEGHFLNWYDTTTRAPLRPHYVSTVDSGNLAAALIALAQGLVQLVDAAADGGQRLEGVIDTAGCAGSTRRREATPTPDSAGVR